MTEKLERQHPLVILYETASNLFLMFGIMCAAMLTNNPASGASILTIALGALALSCLCKATVDWWNCKYQLTDTGLFYTVGLLSKVDRHISREEVHIVEISCTPGQKRLGLCSLKITTQAGTLIPDVVLNGLTSSEAYRIKQYMQFDPTVQTVKIGKNLEESLEQEDLHTFSSGDTKTIKLGSNHQSSTSTILKRSFLESYSLEVLTSSIGGIEIRESIMQQIFGTATVRVFVDRKREKRFKQRRLKHSLELISSIKRSDLASILTTYLPQFSSELSKELIRTPRRSLRRTLLMRIGCCLTLCLIYGLTFNPQPLLLACLASGSLALTYLACYLEWKNQGFQVFDQLICIQKGSFHRSTYYFDKDQLKTMSTCAGPGQRKRQLVDLHFGIATDGNIYKVSQFDEQDAIAAFAWFDPFGNFSSQSTIKVDLEPALLAKTVTISRKQLAQLSALSERSNSAHPILE